MCSFLVGLFDRNQLKEPYLRSQWLMGRQFSMADYSEPAFRQPKTSHLEVRHVRALSWSVS